MDKDVKNNILKIPNNKAPLPIKEAGLFFCLYY